MRNTWQIQEAKARLSGVIARCQSSGPQTVTRHGKPVAVIVGSADWKRWTSRKPDFKAFLRAAPVHDLKLKRSRDGGRPVDL